MADVSSNVQKSFLEGRFAEVTDIFESSKSLQKDNNAFPYWIGSLVLSGQLDKALALYEQRTLAPQQQIACRFYLALGSIRNSQYQQGRKFLIENRRQLSSQTPALEKFFIFQGMAFYRFFCGRFSQAKRDAEHSYKAAIKADFTFGEILSKDLLAHSLIHTGQIRLGLRYFNETFLIAKRVRNQWMGPAIEIAILKFKAQFGIDPQNDVEKLETALEKIQTHDIYSKGELQLELVRQYILRGQFTKAEDTLSGAADIVYKNQNRRQMALLNLRMSYVLFLQAQYTQSLHILRFAEQNIDPLIDLSLWIQISGLKLKIYETLNRSAELKALRQNLSQKSLDSQNQIHKKIMQRSQNKMSQPNALGEDPIGDLLDRVARGDNKAPQLILESGFFGLLHKCYQLPFGTQSVIFDLHPGTVVILDKGNVHLQTKGVNSVLRKIILLIKDEPKSKEQLVQEIWGYQYDPLRHDTLIYSSVNKIRKLLAPHPEWIQLTESGYQIQKSVKIIIKNSLKQISPPSQTAPTPQLDTKNRKPKIQARWAKYAKDLNFRQMQILDYLKTHPSISVLDLSSRLLISKPTATRDLSKLYDLGILTRVGQGRATRYFL